MAARELSTRLRNVNITITQEPHDEMKRMPVVSSRRLSSGRLSTGIFSQRKASAVNALRRSSVLKAVERLSATGHEHATVGFHHSRRMMLLYLNEKTWDNEGSDPSSSLSNEVLRAVANDIDVVMVHEADGSRDGCEFGVFFQTT